MDDNFIIYVDRLKDGRVEAINFEDSIAEIAEEERELKWDAPVLVQGQAYLVEGELVLNLNLRAKILMPCSICNSWVEILIEVRKFYDVIPLSMMKSGVYNFKQSVLDAFFLEIPQFAECDHGHCSKRQEMAKYFHQDKGYQPFKDL